MSLEIAFLYPLDTDGTSSELNPLSIPRSLNPSPSPAPAYRPASSFFITPFRSSITASAHRWVVTLVTNSDAMLTRRIRSLSDIVSAW